MGWGSSFLQISRKQFFATLKKSINSRWPSWGLGPDFPPEVIKLLAHFWGEVTLSDPFLATLIDLRMIRKISPELIFFSARHFFPPTNFVASVAGQYGILTG